MAGTAANRQYKDSVFRDLFGSEKRKGNALSLYNALAGTDYSNPDVLELTTLDDVIYLNVKNDVSFLIGDELVLWEHQSTCNPNMPLRGLVYFGRLFSSYAQTRKLNVYGSRALNLPTPRFFVFYNGPGTESAESVSRLSDLFTEAGDVEVIAHVVNINADSMPTELTRCKELAGYAELVKRVNRNCVDMELSDAVDAAVASCIEDGILSSYLKSRRAEVKDMFMTEYDEEQARRWAREEGIEEGREQGREEATAANVRSLMEKMSIDASKAMDLLGIPQSERDAYNKLLVK